MASKEMNLCCRATLTAFLKNRLEEDEKLEFLLHLDTCPSCWNGVYIATKAAHPHFYKRPTRRSRLLAEGWKGLEKPGKDAETVFEVA